MEAIHKYLLTFMYTCTGLYTHTMHITYLYTSMYTNIHNLYSYIRRYINIYVLTQICDLLMKHRMYVSNFERNIN